MVWLNFQFLKFLFKNIALNILLIDSRFKKFSLSGALSYEYEGEIFIPSTLRSSLKKVKKSIVDLVLWCKNMVVLTVRLKPIVLASFIELITSL